VRGSGGCEGRPASLGVSPDGRRLGSAWGQVRRRPRSRTRRGIAMGRHDRRWRALRAWEVGESGRHSRDHWTRAEGAKRAAMGPGTERLLPENLVSQGRTALCGSFYVALPHRALGRPCHLGTGPAARLLRCITFVAEALAPAATSFSKCPSKLRKIKHLHRKRGATHYRGQTGRQNKGRQAPRDGGPQEGCACDGVCRQGRPEALCGQAARRC
jgi:hypothetical protein